VLTLRHALPPPLAGDRRPPVLAGVALLVAIAGALTAWTVRRLTLPLGTLARAGPRDWPANLDQPPLPETGAGRGGRGSRIVQSDAAGPEAQTWKRARRRWLAVSHDLRLPITRSAAGSSGLSDEATREAIDSDLVEMDRMIGDTLEFLRAGQQRRAGGADRCECAGGIRRTRSARPRPPRSGRALLDQVARQRRTGLATGRSGARASPWVWTRHPRPYVSHGFHQRIHIDPRRLLAAVAGAQELQRVADHPGPFRPGRCRSLRAWLRRSTARSAAGSA